MKVRIKAARTVHEVKTFEVEVDDEWGRKFLSEEQKAFRDAWAEQQALFNKSPWKPVMSETARPTVEIIEGAK